MDGEGIDFGAKEDGVVMDFGAKVNGGAIVTGTAAAVECGGGDVDVNAPDQILSYLTIPFCPDSNADALRCEESESFEIPQCKLLVDTFFLVATRDGSGIFSNTEEMGQNREEGNAFKTDLRSTTRMYFKRSCEVVLCCV